MRTETHISSKILRQRLTEEKIGERSKQLEQGQVVQVDHRENAAPSIGRELKLLVM